ncbi:twin transmembrane helix small protein [Methyloradius palustris]|uniref:Twin transmembrane helix small protein n=1 Tax=Methyloradius palustris TaxID=2778876 RepID=A0A8D5GB97_9PROT|nr:twin transmembrane helix small protein [Methyloradius palustris]BCM25096.1 hypothetical protein ZMTM_13550 [Methyloradius palustris]
MIIKLLIIFMLLLIVGSLFYALFSLVKKGDSERTAKALTIRISLSLFLFVLLMVGFYTGVIGHPPT